MTVQVFLPGRYDRLGTSFEKVVHDGQIVRSKVPENIEVMLEKT